MRKIPAFGENFQFKMANFEMLPNERIVDVALFLPIKNIFSFILTCKRFNIIIRENENFWHHKFIQDYKFDIQDSFRTWKFLYKNIRNVWTFGELHLGDCKIQNHSPVQIFNFTALRVFAGSKTLVMLDMKDNVWIGDKFDLSPCKQIRLSLNLSLKAREVSINNHMIIIDYNNDIWICGRNNHGQLGLGYKDERNQFTKISDFKVQQASVGREHSTFIDLNNNIWTFGHGQYGQLGLNDDENRNVPTQILNLKAKEISAGDNYTILIDLENDLWSFGSNVTGQLGLGNIIRAKIPTRIPNIKAKQVSAGESHTILIDLENNVWTFGNNSFGQLGLGDKENRNTPTQIPDLKAFQVTAGYNYSVVLDLNHDIWTFGLNRMGQLGLGDNKERIIPTKISNIKALQISTSQGCAMLIGTSI